MARKTTPVAKPSPVVKFSATIDVRSIEEAHEKIKRAAAPAGLEVNLSGVTDIDLTFVQLIESARRSAAESGGSLRLSQPATGYVLETLQRGGFLSDPPDERTLFWMGAAP